MVGVQFQTGELSFSLKTYNEEPMGLSQKLTGSTAIQEIITICYDPQEGPNGSYCVYNHDRSDECNGVSPDRDYAIFRYLMKRLGITPKVVLTKKQRNVEKREWDFEENPLAVHTRGLNQREE